MQDGINGQLIYRNPSATGYGCQNPGYQPRRALLRLKDGRLLSGCGGDVEVLHLEETLRAMDTGQPVRVTVVAVFGAKDTVKGIKTFPSSDHIFVYGQRHVALIHGTELAEGAVVSESRILALSGQIVAVDVERQSKTELLLTFLLDQGVFHYSLSVEDSHCVYECLQVFRCNRTIQSGILWRDSAVLHVAYYDGYVRVGIINENYEDMLLVKRIAMNKNHLPGLLATLTQEIERLNNFEEEEKGHRTDMLNLVKKLQGKFSPHASEHENNPQSDEALVAAHQDFVELRTTFKDHTIRSERISQRLSTLRKFLPVVNKALEGYDEVERLIEALEKEGGELEKVAKLQDECAKSGNLAIIEKSQRVWEQKKYEVEKLLRQVKVAELGVVVEEWEKKISQLVETLCGLADTPKDIRNILSHSIYEHRPDKTDKFTHFLLDYSARDLTLYCMSGLTTLAVYPRRGIRVASISLDASYETSLTSACLMAAPLEGVYVADDKGVFPVFFNRQRVRSSPSIRDKRYFDAGNPIPLPTFDHITSILMEENGMILGSLSGGLLHLAFDKTMKYEHVVVASSLLAHPFAQGSVSDVKVLCMEGTFLAISASTMEVAISERDNDRWHRITSHQVPAHCLAVTPFSDEHRGAFVVAGSTVYCRIKALQYAGDLVGLHDLGESKVCDENGKPIEVLNVSMDPSMEFRPFPCKLRYAVGFADKAIRTYVALLTGDHQFNVSEKFIAQIEPLHNVNQLICFNGRPMGCYTCNSKTLQVWNDLDRHQQKKMKSERMELHKMDVGICQLNRVEGRSCYLLTGMKDGRVDIYEERGKGTGKIEKAGKITSVPGISQGIHSRAMPTSTGDRLFIHTQENGLLYIHTALIEAGKMINSVLLLSSPIGLANVRSIQLLPGRSSEFLVYGAGLSVHRLSETERKLLDSQRDFQL